MTDTTYKAEWVKTAIKQNKLDERACDYIQALINSRSTEFKLDPWMVDDASAAFANSEEIFKQGAAFVSFSQDLLRFFYIVIEKDWMSQIGGLKYSEGDIVVNRP